jgi:hypothetical protein
MTARGIRNNNPGNIRLGSPWNGLIDGDDTAFCTFRDPVWGIRALCRLLSNYFTRYELDTVYGIIDRYAPDVENDTNAYAQAVADRLGVGLNEKINVLDREIMRVLVKAIIHHENGSQPYDAWEIADGMLLAGIV